MSEYNQHLIEWTNMKEEKQYTFTITEEDLQRPHSGPHLKSIKHPSQSMSHSEGDLRKYQALPPIGITEIRVGIVTEVQLLLSLKDHLQWSSVAYVAALFSKVAGSKYTCERLRVYEVTKCVNSP